MVSPPRLIFCAGGNAGFYEIAAAAGFAYGSQLPETVYGPLLFADQDFKRPNRAAYMAALAHHRPQMATVLDLEQAAQCTTVLDWAAEAAHYVAQVIIIPKYPGAIQRLPRSIGPAEVVLGYSIPTRYGGAPPELDLAEFAGFPVHLLGGSPHHQIAFYCAFTGRPAPRWMGPRLRHFLARYATFGPIAEVRSVDGNMMQLQANRRCAFWRQEVGARGHWVQLSEVGAGGFGRDSHREAFRRSCRNIIQAWSDLHAREDE